MLGVAPPVAPRRNPPIPRRDLAKTAIGVAPPATGSVKAKQQQTEPGVGKPREPLSSVEEMLTDALGERAPESLTPGSVPLTISGDFKIDETGGGAIVESDGPGTDTSTSSGAPADAPGIKPDSEPPDALTAEPPAAAEASSQAPGTEEVFSADMMTTRDSRGPFPPQDSDDRAPSPGAPVGMAIPPIERPPVSDSRTTAPNPASARQDEAALAETLVSETGPVKAAEGDEGSAEVDAVPLNRSGRTGTILAALAVAAGLVGGGIFALRTKAGSSAAVASSQTSTPSSPAEADPAALAAPTTAPTEPSAEGVPDPASAESPEETEVPPHEAQSPPAPSAQAAEPPAAPEGAPASDEEIPPGMAQLFVASGLDTNVFVHGKMVGKTNTVLLSYCGTRFVRLGTAPGDWQTDGTVLKIKCGERNDLDLR
jgi:hypothetical protein